MPRRRTPCHLAALLAACLGSLAAGTGIARASIISSSPAFPPLGAPFIALTGLGCFPTAGFCTTNGAISFSPADPPTSTFDPSTGQDIKGDVTFTGMLTTLGPNPVPIGSFSFPGTIEMGVAGRMSDTETGTWSAEIDSLSLTASVQGGTLTVGLQTTPSSTGMVSVEPVAGQDGLFRIDSFFVKPPLRGRWSSSTATASVTGSPNWWRSPAHRRILGMKPMCNVISMTRSGRGWSGWASQQRFTPIHDPASVPS